MLTEADVADVAAAGAQFVVTPAVVDSIGAAARRGLPVAAGALTPTEAYTATRMGAAAVKLFPASLGGPAYLKALRDPFPHLPFVAVGGVGLAELPGFLAAGAIAAGVGGRWSATRRPAATWTPCASGPAPSWPRRRDPSLRKAST
ncbi:hypothetical protein ACFSTC_39440 [Nonomuraea ferruginea]